MLGDGTSHAIEEALSDHREGDGGEADLIDMRDDLFEDGVEVLESGTDAFPDEEGGSTRRLQHFAHDELELPAFACDGEDAGEEMAHEMAELLIGGKVRSVPG